MAVFLALAPVSSVGEPVRLVVQTELQATIVAENRLKRFLATAGCNASIGFNRKTPGLLNFYPGQGDGKLLLKAVNRNRSAPVPVWVTRATAGVRNLAELQGRDVSVVAGADPVAGQLALEELASHGVTPIRGQRYEAADFSSALGLLLHNNTHAAISELGFVQPFLDSQNLVINWQGEPVEGPGWYAGQAGAESDENLGHCLKALASISRQNDQQIFQIFPEWVHHFVAPESGQHEEASQ